MKLKLSAKQLIEAEVMEEPTNWPAFRAAIQGRSYSDFIENTVKEYHLSEEAYHLKGEGEIASSTTDFSKYPHVYYNPMSWPHEAQLICSTVPVNFRDAGQRGGIRELKGEALDLAVQTLKSGEGKARFKDRSPFTHKVFGQLDKMHGKPWYK